MCKGVLGLTKRKNSFVEGAFILIAANLITKVIGALFKIPLGNLLGAEGMGVFSVAYNVYTTLFVIATAGLPVAISKLVAECLATGRQEETGQVLRVSLAAFSLFGLAAAALLWLGADQLTAWVGNPMAALAVRAVAPSLLFVSVLAVIRGYYQGLSDMVPTAVSQVLEALGKLLVGYGAACLLLGKGFGLPVAAAGAIGGVTFGSALSTVYLVGRCWKGRQAGRARDCRTPRRRILARIVSFAIPVTVGASVMSLTSLIDMTMVMNRLQDIGFSAKAANELYGSYSLAVTLFTLPQTLVMALAVSIVPVASAYYARGGGPAARKPVETGLRIAALIALPSSLGFVLLAEPILDLIYYSRPVESAAAAPLLAILGCAVFFVALVSLTNSVLQAVGRAHIPVYTMVAGALVKLAVNYLLVGMPWVNICGAPAGTVLCYATISVLNLAALRQAGIPVAYGRIYLRPLAATGLMGAFIQLIRLPVLGYLGARAGVVAVICLAALFYGLMLLALGAVPREDLQLLPGGERLCRLLRL